MKFSLSTLFAFLVSFSAMSHATAAEGTYKNSQGKIISVTSQEVEIPVTDNSNNPAHPFIQTIEPNLHTVNVGGQQIRFASNQNQHSASCTNGKVAKIIMIDASHPQEYFETYERECLEWLHRQKDGRSKPAAN